MSELEVINVSDTYDENKTVICQDQVKVKDEEDNDDDSTLKAHGETILIEDTIISIKDDDEDACIVACNPNKRAQTSINFSSSKRAKTSFNLATSTPIKKFGNHMVDRGLSPIVFPSTKKNQGHHKCKDDGTECNCQVFSKYIKKMEEMRNDIKKLMEEKNSIQKKMSPIPEEREDQEENNIFQTSVINSSTQFISENIHFEGKFKSEGLRPIVIDGSNIAMRHSKGMYFSVRGLKICIDFFLKRGHKVYAFIPSYRLKKHQTDNQRLLMNLVKRKLIFCTSSRELLGTKVCSYDDRILVQVASAMKAVIVSEDNYRDLLLEEPRLRPAIEFGLLTPTWVDDLIIFPADPLGRNGPSLDRFLRYPVPL